MALTVKLRGCRFLYNDVVGFLHNIRRISRHSELGTFGTTTEAVREAGIFDLGGSAQQPISPHVHR
jgi:hypothetical protein